MNKEWKKVVDKAQSTCALCKRWNGEFTEDDKFICKYNNDNKGLIIGFCKNFKQNFKCKYFKRSAESYTSTLDPKGYQIYTHKSITRIRYKQGKFKIRVYKRDN